MNDVVIPVLGVLLPMLAACLIIAALYYIGPYLKGLLLWFFISRAIKRNRRAQEERNVIALETHPDWKWVDDMIEEFNKSIDQMKRRE